MKSLIEYIKESYEEELELKDAINYEQFSDLVMFFDSSNSFNDRKQAVCDVFRKRYNVNLTKEEIKESIVFQRLIDDLVNAYNEEVGENNKVELNFSTRKHLEDYVASKMLIKVKLEQDIPTKQAEED